MTPGLGPAEYASRQNSQDIEQIITLGLNAPYHLLQYGLVEVFNDEIFGLRLTSVIFGLTIFGFLYLLLRGWFGQTIAMSAGLVFVTTPWIILASRTATPNILFLWPVIPVACFVLMSRSKQRASLWWLLLCAAAGLSLYVPGLIWFLLAATVLAGRSFLNISNRVNGLYIVAGMTVFILLASPLILSLALDPARLRRLFLVPADWPSMVELLKSTGWSFAAFFWQTQNHVDIGLGRLPILNILQIALFIFGFYALSARAKNITLALIGLLLFSVLVSAINDNPHLLILGLPAMAIFIAAGLRYLYIEWRRVFPLNPFSYALAISLIILVVGAHLLYAGRYSLVAWPHSTETKTTYVLN